MAVTFTNNWKNILDKLESLLRAEFKGAMPIYRGSKSRAGNQFLRLIPQSSELTEYSVSSEMREFTILMQYYLTDSNTKETVLDHVLRYTSRIEALIHDNMTMELSDSPATEAFNCRMETTTLNADDDDTTYLVEWEYKCQHLANSG